MTTALLLGAALFGAAFPVAGREVELPEVRVARLHYDGGGDLSLIHI